jgi:hypothetical protein
MLQSLTFTKKNLTLGSLEFVKLQQLFLLHNLHPEKQYKFDWNEDLKLAAKP